ncbi:Histidine biosynthesis bifunctional protein hisB [Allomyces arbusculus]|nr:Histidine biosynthesis bifunctional protein hisB [Allomyces arbusculus]
MTAPSIYLLDYGAGNVRSLVNAVHHATGLSMTPITHASDFAKADIVVFPGVGAFGQAINGLRALGFVDALLAYIQSGKPFFGICVGLQSLFSASDETPSVNGLGVVPARITKFDSSTKTVPHMGWNAAITPVSSADGGLIDPTARYYFVHSFAAMYTPALADYAYALTRYGDQTFVAAVRFRNVFATQFHPEKSGVAGQRLLRAYLLTHAQATAPLPTAFPSTIPDALSKRIIACLDIRANDAGQLVVTKGDQYDVRETSGNGDVRNLGDPVDLAVRYYREGADEVALLNITSFRSVPVADLPMLAVLRNASEKIFVPLTIGGGIRDIVEPSGNVVKALDVVAAYFRAGADKVSIGSDAVYAAENIWKQAKNGVLPAAGDGTTAIEQIARVYGAQAVVVSVDPKRAYVTDPSKTTHTVVRAPVPGPNGEQYCWYQCTVKGGREARDLDVVQLVQAVERLGAGEILLNCMDTDGTKAGFDLTLVSLVKQSVRIPVIASSGAGHAQHFVDVFQKTNVDAALAAGIFHRREVPLPSVKEFLVQSGVPTRVDEADE